MFRHIDNPLRITSTHNENSMYVMAYLGVPYIIAVRLIEYEAYHSLRHYCHMFMREYYINKHIAFCKLPTYMTSHALRYITVDVWA